MITKTVSVKNTSPMILSTGQGDASYIDNQMAFDEFGLPYFSGRRFKGLLRESAEEVTGMLRLSGIELGLPSIEEVFGSGFVEGACKFNNLYIQDYEQTKQYLNWAEKNSEGLITRQSVMDALSSVRQQTAVTEEGVSKENSLRTIRVLNPGFEFSGEIDIHPKYYKTVPKLLMLAARNLRYAGLNRTRGFGRIDVKIGEEKENRKLISEVEKVV